MQFAVISKSDNGQLEKLFEFSKNQRYRGEPPFFKGAWAIMGGGYVYVVETQNSTELAVLLKTHTQYFGGKFELLPVCPLEQRAFFADPDHTLPDSQKERVDAFKQLITDWQLRNKTRFEPSESIAWQPGESIGGSYD